MSGGDNLDFEIRPNPAPVGDAERTALLANPGFGRIFTDHMVTVRYADGKGWYEPRVEARAPIPMDPASAVLHYAQEIFEGLKAYTLPDGGVAMFRPDANAARFAESAKRMAMPALPVETFLRSLHEIIKIDRSWIPQSEEGSLYLRPFAYASEVFLGVRPAMEYLYLVIASPAGPYFSGGVKPVSLWVTPDYTRAAPGGTGAAKCGGNYAAGLSAQAEAIEHGCDQVVYLDAIERKYIDELGGMNVFFVLDDGTLVTPPLTGTILPGITRDSVIKLAERAGHKVEERPVSLEEWRSSAASGQIREAFACGTAAVITPIGVVKSAGAEFTVGDGGTGPVTTEIRKQLVDIQRGRAEDPFGWVHRVL
ncbi:branched-chain amino acid aminotransferase [Paractinoplanes atraurantiacus]|uniref:Branched-chain-amino-acid aminotransferase n=1 Tax=Paractinoplanes atraurantiacus TaxID=1036182 RepID=A0A285FNL3_9ACTN|nr:branched-chain amino acid aminotransferase [Actinoplanes atraurantiacus]SNY12815.1 branched-chain amino acid aminotransferase [Actinoplanes atraurantiacus]